MSEDTTTTNAPETNGVDADNVPAPAQPEQTETAEAEVSTESATTEPTNDDEISQWAEKKGLKVDLSNPDVAQLVKMQREAEQKMHTATTQASELKNIINEEAQSLTSDDSNTQLAYDMQVIKAERAVEAFYANNPEAREYDADMAELVKENPNLAQGGLEALYAVAKVRRMENGGTEEIKQEGKKEALQNLALKQKVASVTSNATQNAPSNQGITQADVQNALANHDIAWLRSHQSEIDAL